MVFRLVGCDVVFVLAHSGFEGDTSLADIFSVLVARTIKLVHSFLVNSRRTCPVGATEKVS